MLLFVSCAIVLRSFFLRRRFRRHVEEQIAAGLLPPDAALHFPRRVDLGAKPTLYDVVVQPVGTSVDMWDYMAVSLLFPPFALFVLCAPNIPYALLPRHCCVPLPALPVPFYFYATVLTKPLPFLFGSVQPVSAKIIAPDPPPDAEEPDPPPPPVVSGRRNRLSRLFPRRRTPPDPAPPPDSAANGVFALEGHDAQVAVMIAMPGAHDMKDGGVPDVLLGISKVPLRAD